MAGNRVLVGIDTTVSTEGESATTISLSGDNTADGYGNTAIIAGTVKATGKDSVALKSYGKSDGTAGGSNTFYLLGNASITGEVLNADKSKNTTSYLVFGLNYKTSAIHQYITVKPTEINSDTDITISGDIKSDSTGAWDGFIAGGSTTLAGGTNLFKRIFIGGDSFDGTTVADGPNGSKTDAKTVDLDSINNAEATFTVKNSIATATKVVVGKGSTYNLNGTHTHEFSNADSYSVLGTLNIGSSGKIVDYGSNNAVALTLGGRSGSNNSTSGTLNSSAANQSLELTVYNGTTGNVNVNGGTLTLSKITNNGQLNADVANGAALNIKDGVTLSTCTVNGTLTTSGNEAINLGAVTGSGTAILGGTGIKYLSSTTLSEVNVTGNSTVQATGTLKVGTLDIDANTTLVSSGTNAITATNTQINANRILTTSGNSTVNLGTVSGGGSVNFGGSGNKSLQGTNLSELNVTGASTVNATGTLEVDTLDIDANVTLNNNNNTVTASSGTEIANGTLTLSGGGAVDLGAVSAGSAAGLTINDGTGEVTLDSVELGAGEFKLTNNKSAAQQSLGDITTTNDAGKFSIEANSKVSAGSFTVKHNTTLNTGADFAATSTSVDASKTLTTSDDSAVDLGEVTGTGTVVFGGTGDKSLHGTTLSKLNVTGKSTVNATGTLEVDTLDIDNAVTLNNNNNTVTASSGTELASGTLLTLSGGGAVDLGAVSAGSAAGLTINNGTGEVTINSVELGAGEFKLIKNNSAAQQSLGNITTTADAGKLSIEANSKVSAGSFTVKHNTTLNTESEFAATSTSVDDKKTLTTSGNSAVDLGEVTGTGTVVFGGTGDKSLHGTTLSKLNVTGKSTVNATGELKVKTLDIDNTVTLDNNGKKVTASSGTEIANGTLTLKGSGAVDLGAVSAGSAAGLTINNDVGEVTISSVELGAGEFTLTNNKSGAQQSLGDITTTADAGKLSIVANANSLVRAKSFTASKNSTANSLVKAKSFTVSHNTTLNTESDFAATSTRVVGGKTLTTSGGSAVDLGEVTGSGTIKFGGAGDKSLSGNSTTTVQFNDACTMYADADLTVDMFDFAAEATVNTQGNVVTASTGSTLAAGLTLNANGGGSVNLGALNTAAGRTINVAAGTTVGFGTTDLTDSRIVLDFGDNKGTDGNADLGTYAKLTGVGNLTVSMAGNSINEIFGFNGIIGLTYKDVFDAGSTDIKAGDRLNTDDDLLVYQVASNGVDIIIKSAADELSNKINNNGGSDSSAKAGGYMLEHKDEFDSAGQAYADKLSNLSGAEAARAAAQTIGEGATAPSTQSSLMAITSATSSVENQMVNFRLGNIAQGMASSFGGSGATSALDNIADASELEVAYESGFTSGVDTTEYKKVTVWANGFGGFGEQGTIGNDIGYSFWNAGTLVGLDYAIAKELRVGALLGYSYNKTTINWHSGDSKDNALRIGAYASYNWNDFFVDLSPTMGVHMIESNRNIWDGSVAKGDRTGLDFNMSTTVGYNFNLPFGINFVPEYTLNYTLFNDPQYTETGADAANVTYSSYTSNSLVQDVGIKLGKLIKVSDKLSFLPEVWGGWEHEFLDTGGERNTVTSASIGAQAYTTEMNAMAPNRGYWGLGVTALLKDNVSIYGRYDQRVWHKGFNISFLAGIKIKVQGNLT